MYLGGETYEAISLEMGWSVSTVMKYVKAAGVQSRSVGPAPGSDAAGRGGKTNAVDGIRGKKETGPAKLASRRSYRGHRRRGRRW